MISLLEISQDFGYRTDTMDLILLSGNSPLTKDWIEKLEKKLAGQFDQAHIQYYDHWEDGGSFRAGKEREKLVKTAKSMKEYVIVAKSVGVFLAMDTTLRGLISPSRCIFMGTTGRSASLLDAWEVPTLFIQETSDPFLSFDELSKEVIKKDNDDLILEEIPGTKHWYEKVDEIVGAMKNYLSITS